MGGIRPSVSTPFMRGQGGGMNGKADLAVGPWALIPIAGRWVPEALVLVSALPTKRPREMRDTTRCFAEAKSNRGLNATCVYSTRT